jgi:hypothetical protein
MSEHFVAEITLLDTPAGGRVRPLASGEWRTVLGVSGEHWSARLTFQDCPCPGDVFEARVQLLIPEASTNFPVGAAFTIWENGTKGTGRVVSLVA